MMFVEERVIGEEIPLDIPEGEVERGFPRRPTEVRPHDTRTVVVRNGRKIVVYGKDTSKEGIPGRDFRSSRRRNNVS